MASRILERRSVRARDTRAPLCRHRNALIEPVGRQRKREAFCRTWQKVLPRGSLFDVADAVTILKISRDHSEWPQVKRTEDELLRCEYLRLSDERCYFQPDWIHTEMRQRQAARADGACVAEMAVTSRVAFLPALLPSGRTGHVQ